jgi:hypothetical protein
MLRHLRYFTECNQFLPSYVLEPCRLFQAHVRPDLIIRIPLGYNRAEKSVIYQLVSKESAVFLSLPLLVSLLGAVSD